MSPYVELSIADDADTLVQRAKDYLVNNTPGLVLADSDPESTLFDAVGLVAEAVTEIAANMPAAAWREAGRSLDQVPYLAGAPAEALVTFSLADTAGYTIRANTYVQIGDSFFATVDDATADPGSATIDNVLVRCSETGAAANGLTGPIKLVNSLARVNSVSLVGTTSGGADAEDDDAYQDRLVGIRALTGIALVTPQNYATAALSVPDVAVARAVAIDGYNPLSNLLTPNQASFETSTTGWAIGANCTIARSTTFSRDGMASLAVTVNNHAIVAEINTPTEASGFGVIGGTKYAVRLDAMAPGSGDTSIVIRYYSAGGSSVGSSTLTHTHTSSAWEEVLFVSTAPSTAAYATVIVDLAATANGDVFYIDNVKVGTSLDNGGPLDSLWVPGGSSQLSNPRTVSVAVTDAQGVALSDADKTAIKAYLQARREVNFVVNVIDASYNFVAVEFSYQVYPGFDSDALAEPIKTALRGYINPATWGLPQRLDDSGWTNETVVRVNKLIGLIENVPGVDYVDTIKINGSTSNLTLTGVVPLPAIPDDVTKTGSTASSDATVTIAVEGLHPNMWVTGPGIPAGAKVLSVGTTSIELTANSTATASGVELSFSALLGQAV